MKYSFGSNDIPASGSFEERSQYARNYPSSGIYDHSYVDYWYEHPLYGRIDSDENSIYPSAAFMKQIPDTSEQVYALNFVADAFNDLRRKMVILASEGQTQEGGLISLSKNLQPKLGWEDINPDYDNIVRNFLGVYLLPFLAVPERAARIRGFYDFVEQFVEVIDRYTLLLPFTKTEYIASNLADPLYSGLAVEIDDSFLHGDDLYKIASYINNLDFELYRQQAAIFGFALDKNAPWRLVALPYTPQMQSYMLPYGISRENLTDNYYYRSYTFDIPNMKTSLLWFYNSFATRYPSTKVPVVSGENQKRNLTDTIQRDIITEEQYQEEGGWFFDNDFWIRMYVYIRAKETNRDWNQYKFDQVSAKAVQFFQYSGEATAHKFINKEVRRPWGEDKVIGRYRRGNFRFQRK
jgi:hypothetical protein